ncbi:MAG: pseudaminic acid synthase [Pseudomonadota bacterium]|uniref:Pseudaminic acid synthase n=1 Tax=Alteromonas alba TaxID=2079529 RepID=A0A2S9VEB3_9ALTE|nr:pseudaminic acid synthase [Alteromonas alba]MDY6928504.1 pseudaminic acid synthase [Pseudomonadota bacterium]PRO74802.1 pseudaminic acid synthase [Alteromonas alba]
MAKGVSSDPIYIGHREISARQAPFIIAELSGNHSQSLDTARAMVKTAAESGAHAIKLQTYTADSMTLDVTDKGFVIEEQDSLWHGASLYRLYQKAATPYEWHAELFDYANSLGMLAFSSPFDEAAVDFLDELNVPCFKIASFELTDIPLIRKAASKGKPLIMSTGMASLSEIELAVDTARNAGCEDIILLKCTSTYPAEPVNTNLLTIPHLRDAFGCEVGLSDHTGGIGAAVASVALGASVIEKHFVLDRNGGGVDAAFSLEPEELTSLVVESERAWQALGQVKYGGTVAEDKSKQYRRSIYASQDIQPGEALGPDNLKIVRPAFGLAPKHWDSVLHKKAADFIKKGTALSWEHISQ